MKGAPPPLAKGKAPVILLKGFHCDHSPNQRGLGWCWPMVVLILALIVIVAFLLGHTARA